MNCHALRALALALPALACLPAQALVQSGHWYASYNPYTAPLEPGVIYVDVDQTPDGDHTATFLKHNAAANTLSYLTQNLDEGSQLFLVQAGQALTHASIALLPGSARLDGLVEAVSVGEDFYLGVRTGSASDPGFNWASPEGYTSFGWAHFREGSDGKLYIVDSAMAFREGGIVVGTMQAVPEPATWASLIAGLAALGAIARRQTPVTA